MDEGSEQAGAAGESPFDHVADQLRAMGEKTEAQFEETDSMGDLNLIIQVASAAVELLPREHSDLPSWLNNLGHWLGRRSERNRSVDDLDQAIATIQSALGIVKADDALWPIIWTNLGIRLARRFEMTGSISHLDRAIEATKTAIEATPIDGAHRAGCLNNLGVWFGKRYERLGSVADLDQAIDLASAAVEIARENPTSQCNWMVSLGNKLHARFERTGSMVDLIRAVEILEAAKQAIPRDHPSRPLVFNALGNQLAARFKRLGNIDDLDRAIEVARIAAEDIPLHHLDRAGILHNLANKLGVRFNHKNSVDDLDRAIETAESALEITPQDHCDRPFWLNCLGGWLASRSDLSGSMEDLDRAIDLIGTALQAISDEEPLRAGLLNNLGTMLTTRFTKTGSVEDLQNAVDVAAKAFEATPDDHPNRALMACNLGISAMERWKLTGLTEDLDRAIDYFRIAAQIAPDDSPDRVRHLHNLGLSLSKQFVRTGLEDSLNQAIDVLGMAAGLAHKGHACRARVFHMLGTRFWIRFRLSRSESDYQQAVEKLEVAIQATPLGDPERFEIHHDIGTMLSYVSKDTGSLGLLERAIKHSKAAVNAKGYDETDRARYCLHLATSLEEMHRRTGSADDLASALAWYQEGWGCRTAQPSVRIELAQRVAHILTLQSEWDEASEVLHEAVYLVRHLSPRSLPHTDKQRMLASCAELARMATAVALNAGKDPVYALQLLELGRGVIAGSLVEMRTDISDLEHQHPGLAAEFTVLRDELDAPHETSIFILPTGNTSLWQSQTRRRHELDQRFSSLISQIRDQPGFRNFLLPTTLGELKAAADPGPIVVINLSPYRCDAFLVERDRIRLLRLPALTPDDAERRVGDLRASLNQGSPAVDLSLLEWLWDAACGPILEALGFTGCPPPGGRWPQVWWIPTGLLSLLPLHAAGRHASASAETVLDRVMSSYAPSVKALLHGRRDRAPPASACGSPASKPDRALLIAMPTTPGLTGAGALPFAADEVSMLRGLCEPLQLEPVCPRPLKDAVLGELGSCKIFHFAGHGRSDPAEPSRSCLLLQDWEQNPLTVDNLRGCKFHESQPFLGYLSACSTGASDADELADEGIHLVSSLQLAGFRHVVGTLWKVSDSHCVDVARVFYETMRNQGMTDAAVCLGLHMAVRTMRDSCIVNEAGSRDARLLVVGKQKNKQLENSYWVPYVHFGV